MWDSAIGFSIDTFIEETGEVMDKVKQIASEASRKGKTAIRAIKS